MVAFNVRDLIKRYWDILGGFITGVGVSILARFELGKIQLVYSIIILVLVSIGVFKIIKQSMEKERGKKAKKRKKTIIDDMVDGQKPVKAINLAQSPTKEGEKLGQLLLDTFKEVKKKMKKIKVLFDKFKGYLLTGALTVLTIVEMCGGFINDMLGDALTIKGVEVLPLITLVAAIIVGCISNGFTKEQQEKVKALFAKSTTDELVTAEIKKELKEDESKLNQANKLLATKETELDNLNSALVNAKNTLEAKKKMFNMVPQLATEEVVQAAANEVVNIEAKIEEKKDEIAKVNLQVVNLTKTIAALKSQL